MSDDTRPGARPRGPSGAADTGRPDRSEVARALAGPAPAGVTVGGVTVARGTRVRLRPRPRGDVLDLALAGRVALVEGIDQDLEDRIHVTVTLEDDPGRDLGEARALGHRFFFDPDEVEPLDDAPAARSARVLVAGIGNVFLGDDGFGVEVARRLRHRARPPGFEVADFGIRAVDLAYALGEGWDATILVDAAPRGAAPGTLHVIEPEVDAPAPASVDGHGMDPVMVLGLARRLGRLPPRVLVVGCEPATPGDPDDMTMGLSPPVTAVLERAVALVESLVAELMRTREVIA